MIKKCVKCLIDKEENLDNFYFRNDRNIFFATCKKCIKESSKQYNTANKDKRKQYRLDNKERINQYFIDNKDKIKESKKQHYINNKDNISLKAKQYYLENSHKIIAYSKLYYFNKKDEIKEKQKQYNAANKDKRKQYRLNNKKRILEKQQQYRLNNKNNIKEYDRKYTKERSKKDISFRLRRNISGNIRKALKIQGSCKSSMTWQMLPYSPEDLKIHLESLFESWMTWENYGQYKINKWNDNNSESWTWQIDHIIPQSRLLYDSMDHPNFKECWALSNLRPLSSKINLEKSNK